MYIEGVYKVDGGYIAGTYKGYWGVYRVCMECIYIEGVWRVYRVYIEVIQREYMGYAGGI